MKQYQLEIDYVLHRRVTVLVEADTKEDAIRKANDDVIISSDEDTVDDVVIEKSIHSVMGL